MATGITMTGIIMVAEAADRKLKTAILKDSNNMNKEDRKIRGRLKQVNIKATPKVTKTPLF